MNHWPFRRKLNVLVAVPLAVVAVLLAYLLLGLVRAAHDAANAARLVRDSKEVAELVDRMQTEHQQALLLSVRYEAATPGERPSSRAYRQAQDAVAVEVGEVREAFGTRLPADEAQVLREIDGLGSLRATVEQGYLPAEAIDPAYDHAVDDLIDGLGLDLDTSLALTRTGNLLDSLLRADAAQSAFETSVFGARTGDSNALIEYNQAVGDERVYAYQLERFGRYASPAQYTQLAAAEHNPQWNGIQLQYAGLEIDPAALATTRPDGARQGLREALRAYPDYRRQAQDRLDITRTLIRQIAARAEHASNRSWWHAVWLLSGTLLAFVLWLAFTVVVRRSVVHPVQALTGAAVEVADVAGEELARVADGDAAGTDAGSGGTGPRSGAAGAGSGGTAGPPRLRKVSAPARDEFGDLADAFNRVQSTAVALLERQAASRRNVAEMFGNIGRRVSNLTARQLALIDAVERGESDPELLDRLYRIDHLTVRLQRNADSLMLLAGIREAGIESGPLPLTTVVRAALGRIEDYQRVEVSSAGQADEPTVAPDIIADVTLMLAELADNAVTFSPAHSTVRITVRPAPEGTVVEVADHGLGMSPERLAEENARLVRRERLDVTPTKVLGLFVVGRIARHWGITVTLAPTPGGGTTARVFIPSALLLRMSPFAVPPSAAPSVAARPRPAAATGAAGTRAVPGGAAALAPRERDAEEAGARGGAAGERTAAVGGDSAAAGEYADAAGGRTAAAGEGPAGGGQQTSGERAAAVGRARHESAGGAGDAAHAAGAGLATRESAQGGPGGDPGEEQRGAAGPPPLRRRVRGATLRGRAEVRPVRTDAAAHQQGTAGAGGAGGGSAGSDARPARAEQGGVRPPGPRGPGDAAAAHAAAADVRAQLDEFEAAVARAHRDSAAAAAPRGSNEEEQ